ncbi:hypothetical protein RQP54_17845 [Curvibacter sp. APW13]|uniref:hypothetical protein n=1 Tax=Curvibacter sp. APW13 TaxID=3077236 RepID=UPI0028DF8D58|nr:hypothetical protein [Curvibacter sp. APW13]MDT8992740.1 hypothetical protein [Curvibacter sp. APW13]
MQPFAPPPLKIMVRTLDGVDDRPFNHRLTPADIRKDAFYQKLAKRNAALEWRLRHRRSITILTALIVFALNVLYLTPWAQTQKQAWLDKAFAWTTGASTRTSTAMPIGGATAATRSTPSAAPQAVAPAPVAVASTPTIAMQPAAQASTPVAPSAPVTAAQPAPATPTAQPAQQPDAANQLAAALKALIEQQTTKAQTQSAGVAASPAANKPITVVPSITSAKPVVPPAPQSAPAQREPLPVHESAPLKVATPLSIMDFFGTNTAVLLSSDGGQTMRAYRVGDTLPSGEVIKAIDSTGGAVTTNQRIIRKQEPK